MQFFACLLTDETEQRASSAPSPWPSPWPAPAPVHRWAPSATPTAAYILQATTTTRSRYLDLVVVLCTIDTGRDIIDRHVRFNSGAPLASNLPCASKLDQAFPSAASRDFLGAWLVPKCAHFRGGSIWQVEIAALRGWARSHDRRVPTTRALLAGYKTNTSPSTHCSSCAPHRLENLLDSPLPMLSGPVLTCADRPNSTASYPLYCAPCRTRHENALVPGLVSLSLTPARAASATRSAV